MIDTVEAAIADHEAEVADARETADRIAAAMEENARNRLNDRLRALSRSGPVRLETPPADDGWLAMFIGIVRAIFFQKP